MVYLKMYGFNLALISIMVCFSQVVIGQVNCEELKFEGLYINNKETKHIAVVLSSEHLISAGVYTSMNLYLENGDTLTNSTSSNFILPPHFGQKTFAYILPLHESYSNIYELPLEMKGVIKTKYPDCEVPFQKVFYDETDQPGRSDYICSDYELIGVFPAQTLHVEGFNVGALIGYTNADLPGLESGYTGFELYDQNDNSITNFSGNHYQVPTHIRDTVFIPLKTHDGLLPEEECFILQSRIPDCDLEYCLPTNLKERGGERREVVLFPNPVKELLRIESKEEITKLIIKDRCGKTLLESESRAMDVGQLFSGTYLIQIHFRNGAIAHQLFNKI